MPSKLAFTAAASTGEPSEKVAPERRWKVKLVESGLTVQRSASHGVIAPVFGSWSVSESTS